MDLLKYILTRIADALIIERDPTSASSFILIEIGSVVYVYSANQT